jgi:hypothetical protein
MSETYIKIRDNDLLRAKTLRIFEIIVLLV